MTMDLVDLYRKVECPYNKSHMVCPLRMPYHLHRCRKNYPNVEMSVCPYNATHEVKTPELKYHMTHCPNRTLLERDMPYNCLQNALLGKEDTAIKGNTEIPHPVIVSNTLTDGVENWDEDDSPIVFKPQETARSERRNRDRRNVESHLRIPQRQSIAASFTTAPGNNPDRNRTGSNTRNNASNKNSSCNDSDSHSCSSSTDNNSICNDNSNNNNNSSTKSTSSTERLGASSDSPQGRILASSLLSTGHVNESPSNELSCRLNQMTIDSSNPIYSMTHLLAIGRGRARPALSPSATQSSSSQPLIQRPGLSGPPCIRMGRGGVRPTFRS